MLRFRRDRLYVGIERDRLSLVRVASTRLIASQPTVIHTHCVSLDGGMDDGSRHSIIQQEISASPWRRALVHVVLGEKLANYFVAAQPIGARNLSEVQQAANLRFEELFGGNAPDWEIRLEQSVLATNQLGCADQEETTFHIICKLPFCEAAYICCSLRNNRGQSARRIGAAKRMARRSGASKRLAVTSKR